MCLEEEKESKSRIWIDRALRGTPNHFSSCFQHSYVLTIDQRYSVKPAVLISVLKILVTSKFFVLKPTHLLNMLFFSFFFKSKFKSLAKYCLYGSVSFGLLGLCYKGSNGTIYSSRLFATTCQDAAAT